MQTCVPIRGTSGQRVYCFALTGSGSRGHRKRLSVDRLREVFVREFSIAPQDVGTAATRVSVRGHDGVAVRGRCVCVYDEVYGSLRLTERLFTDFGLILRRLQKAVAVEVGDVDIEETVGRVTGAAAAFEEVKPFGTDGAREIVGREYVFTPGSVVCYRERGQLAVDVKVRQPTVMDRHLMYQVEVPGERRTKRWVPASAVEPSADAGAWGRALWNRETEEYEEE